MGESAEKVDLEWGVEREREKGEIGEKGRGQREVGRGGVVQSLTCQ